MPNEIEQLRLEVAALRQEVAALSNPGDVSPMVVSSLGTRIIQLTDVSVGSYDTAVDEAGAGSYEVPKIWDGLARIPGNKLIGYYDIV